MQKRVPQLDPAPAPLDIHFRLVGCRSDKNFFVDQPLAVRCHDHPWLRFRIVRCDRPLVPVRLGGGRIALAPRLLGVAKLPNDFKDLAAGGEHSSAGAFVVVKGVHELDLIVRIVSLARGGVDLPTPRHFLPAFEFASFRDGRLGVGPTIRAPPVDGDFCLAGRLLPGNRLPGPSFIGSTCRSAGRANS